MHVLIVPSWYPDAPGDANGSFFREQAIALASGGEKTGVIYPNFRSLRKIAQRLTGPNGVISQDDEGVTTYRLLTFNWSPRFSPGIHRQWIRHGLRLFDAYVAAQGMPDVVHAHSMVFAGVLGVEIRRRYGVPLVVTEHSTGYAKELLSAYELRCADHVARTADRKLAVSAELASLLNQKFPASPTWQTLPNIVNQAFLDRELRAKVPGRDFRFVNVALLNKIKRHDNLIRAYAAAFNSDSGVSLTIAGDGPERSALHALIKELQLEGRVTLLGHVERQAVPLLLSESNAFVLSSGYETFGVVIAEALAMGLPVVSTACGGPNSIVTPKDGLLVDVDSIDQLSRAMLKMRSQISEYSPEDIRARCSARYSEAAIVERLTAVYRELH